MIYNIEHLNDIIIKRATTADIDSLAELRFRLLVEVGDITDMRIEDEIKQKFRDYFLKNIPDNTFIAYVAEYKKQIIASSGLIIQQYPPTAKNITQAEGYIMNIYTLPEWRKKGIASLVLKQLIRYTESTNIKKLWLRASDDGKKLYKKMGFLEDSHFAYMIKWI